MRDRLKNKKIWPGAIITMFVFLAIVAEVAEVNAQGPAFPLTPGSGHMSNTLNSITWDWVFIEPTDITACSYPGLYYEVWDMYFDEVVYDTRSSPIPCVSNWTETGLSANEPYDRCVKACDASGCSGFSTTCELSGAGIAYTSIETPTGISCSEISSSSIKVTALGNFTNLLGNASGIQFWIQSPYLTSGFIQATNYTFNGLDPDTTYSIYSRSRNGDGDLNSSVGPQNCTTWSGILGQLSKPTNVRHINNPESPLEIWWQWDPVPNSTGYIIYMKDLTCTVEPCTYYTQLDYNTTSNSIILSVDYNNNPFNYNTQYAIKVMATDITGTYTNSELSSPSSAYTSALSPINLLGTVFSNSQINWTWQSGGGNSGFYARNTQGGSKGWTADLFWNQAGLGCGISYTLQIKAKNADYNNCAAANGCALDDFICMESKCPGDAAGWKDSNSVIIETLIAPSNAELPEANITAASMKLAWTDTLNEEGYKIERAQGDSVPGSYSQIATVGANVTSYIDDTPPLTQNTHYWYRVKAYSSIACDSSYAEANAWTKGPKIAINPITYPVGNIDYNYNFGTLVPGDSKSVAMLICNLGEVDLMVSSASINPIGDFSFTPPGSSFILGVDSTYNNCDNNLAAIAKKEIVIKFTAPLPCNANPASFASFILQNNDTDKIISLKGVCQEPPVGEGQPSENVIYDGRIMANPPPAFVEFLKKLQISEKIKPR